jgi:hypothetical protein
MESISTISREHSLLGTLSLPAWWLTLDEHWRHVDVAWGEEGFDGAVADHFLFSLITSSR